MEHDAKIVTLMNPVRQSEKHIVATNVNFFCDSQCLFLYMLDLIIDTPSAIEQVDRNAWIPVIKQLHDEILK